MSDPLLQRAAALLRPVPDFPKPGILFWDIAPVLRDPEVFSHLLDLMVERWKDERIDVIAGFDARGFIFGAALALRMGLPFEQIRKKGKLPGKTRCQWYVLEYGKAEVEMIDDGFITGKRVLLVDDLLATGGTARAGAELVKEFSGTVAGFACVTELPELAGRAQLLDYPVQSLISVIEGKPYIDVEYCVDMLTFDNKTNELMLIERLNEPKGLAMPGGHIERESALAATKRELQEETACTFEPGYCEFFCVLTKPGRDPRGLKVSYVQLVFCDTSQARAEAGKTRIVKVNRDDGLPERSRFVLGHAEAVYKCGDVLRHCGLLTA